MDSRNHPELEQPLLDRLSKYPCPGCTIPEEVAQYQSERIAFCRSHRANTAATNPDPSPPPVRSKPYFYLDDPSDHWTRNIPLYYLRYGIPELLELSSVHNRYSTKTTAVPSTEEVMRDGPNAPSNLPDSSLGDAAVNNHDDDGEEEHDGQMDHQDEKEHHHEEEYQGGEEESGEDSEDDSEDDDEEYSEEEEEDEYEGEEEYEEADRF